MYSIRPCRAKWMELVCVTTLILCFLFVNNCEGMKSKIQREPVFEPPSVECDQICWKVKKNIGGGSYGEVFLVEEDGDEDEDEDGGGGKRVAAMKVSRQGKEGRHSVMMANTLEHEFSVLQTLSGKPHIMELLTNEMCKNKKPSGAGGALRKKARQLGNTFFLVKFYEQGSLKKFAENMRPRVSAQEWLYIVLEILKQISLGMKEMHELGYSHRDIKPTNILITMTELAVNMQTGSVSGFEAVLGDFGTASRLLDDDGERSDESSDDLSLRSSHSSTDSSPRYQDEWKEYRTTTSIEGTAIYLPPENQVVTKNGQLHFPLHECLPIKSKDIWGLGVIAMELLLAPTEPIYTIEMFHYNRKNPLAIIATAAAKIFTQPDEVLQDFLEHGQVIDDSSTTINVKELTGFQAFAAFVKHALQRNPEERRVVFDPAEFKVESGVHSGFDPLEATSHSQTDNDSISHSPTDKFEDELYEVPDKLQRVTPVEKNVVMLRRRMLSSSSIDDESTINTMYSSLLSPSPETVASELSEIREDIDTVVDENNDDGVSTIASGVSEISEHIGSPVGERYGHRTRFSGQKSPLMLTNHKREKVQVVGSPRRPRAIRLAPPSHAIRVPVASPNRGLGPHKSAARK